MLRYWNAVCRHGPCGPTCSLHPWDGWVTPDLHVFCKWVFDSLDVLNEFTRQVVVSRRDTGIRKWARWLREDLGSRPYAWLRRDFVPPSPVLVVKDPLTEACWLLVEPHLTDAEFCKAWMPFSVGLVILLSLLISSRILSVISCFRNLSWIFLGSRVGICRRLRRQRSLLLEGLDGWAWNEHKALPSPWFSFLAILLELVETSGIWPQGLLDAYIAWSLRPMVTLPPWVRGPLVSSSGL